MTRTVQISKKKRDRYQSLKFFSLFIMLLLPLFGGDQNNTETLQTLRQSYEKHQGFWLNLYQENRKILQFQSRIESVKKKLEQKNTIKLRQELQRELSQLESQLETAQEIEQRYRQNITLPLKELEATELNLFSYLTGSPRRKVKELTKQWHQNDNEVNEVLLRIDTYLEKSSQFLELNASEQERTAWQDFLDMLQQQRLFFVGIQENLLEQKQTLRAHERLILRKIESYEDKELIRLIATLGIVAVLVVAVLLTRRLIDRYVVDEDRQFALKHTLNLMSMLLGFLIIFFIYIEKVTHALTLFGFISVGLTIVLKEVWLNIAAWLYISFSGIMRIGDRVLLTDQMRSVIGDVIGISPMRITLYEMINHTSAVELKRAGRIAILPPNVIFSRSFYNYTHERLKTLYDLIEIDLGIETDLDHAEAIATEVVEHQTMRYIDLTNRQFTSIQNRYEVRNMSFKPQVQFLMNNERNCIRMHLWYIAPYRDILQVRSEILKVLLKAFMSDDRIVWLREK